MTDQLEALRELAKKVEAGEALPLLYFLNVFDVPSATSAWLCQSADLNAAKALHEAVLPGWDWNVCSWAGADIHPGEDQLAAWMPGGNYDNPARSWLLAILRALIAREEAK